MEYSTVPKRGELKYFIRRIELLMPMLVVFVKPLLSRLPGRGASVKSRSSVNNEFAGFLRTQCRE